QIVRGRQMRVDTTVVESNIHYPTDSGLLNDGTRALTRTMKKIEQKAGGLQKKIRDRKRSVTKRVIAIAPFVTRGPPERSNVNGSMRIYCGGLGRLSAMHGESYKKWMRGRGEKENRYQHGVHSGPR